jgi:hypothetical protein
MLVNSRRVCESTRLCVQGVAEAPIGEVVPGGRQVCNGHTTEQDQHERDSSTSGHEGISVRPCNEMLISCKRPVIIYGPLLSQGEPSAQGHRAVRVCRLHQRGRRRLGHEVESRRLKLLIALRAHHSTARTRRVVARVWIWLLGRESVCSGRRSVCSGRRIAAAGRKFNAPAGGCLLAARDRYLRPANRRLGAGLDCFRRRAAPSAAHSAARRREPSARQSVRPLRPRAGAFAARIVRSASRPPASAVRAPARTPGGSRWSRIRLRRNSSTGFRHRNVGSCAGRVCSALDPLPPEPDSSSREPIRCLPNPICRLRRRMGRLRCPMRNRSRQAR